MILWYKNPGRYQDFEDGLGIQQHSRSCSAKRPRPGEVVTWATPVSGGGITGGGSGYAALLAHAEGVLYGMELGSVTLKINTQNTLKTHTAQTGRHDYKKWWVRLRAAPVIQIGILEP